MSGRLGPAFWLGSSLALAAACSEGEQFAAWPAELVPELPAWLVVGHPGSAPVVLGPVASASPVERVELEEASELYVVQPDLEAMRGQSGNFDPGPGAQQLSLGLRPPASTCPIRSAPIDGRLSVPSGGVEAWRVLDLETAQFEAASAPPLASELEWSAPYSEETCLAAAPELTAFGAEPTMFSPTLLAALGNQAPLHTDLISVWPIDEDRVIAGSDVVLYLFRRGEEPRDSFGGPAAVHTSDILDAPIPNAIWSLRGVSYTSRPVPRALAVLVLVHATEPRTESVVVAVDIEGDQFGASTVLGQAPELSDIDALDEERFVAVGGRTVMVGTSSGTPVSREMQPSWGLQSLLASKTPGRLVFGGRTGLIWTGDATSLLERPLEAEPITGASDRVRPGDPIVAFAEGRDEGGERSLWALTFLAGLLRRTVDQTWQYESLTRIPYRSTDTCLGTADQCGLLEWSTRVLGLDPWDEESLILQAEQCPELIIWNPLRSCAARVMRPRPELRIVDARPTGRGLIAGGLRGLLLEARR